MSAREKVARAIERALIGEVVPADQDHFFFGRESIRHAADAAVTAIDDTFAEALMKPRASDALLSAMVDAVLDAAEELDLRDWKLDAGFNAAKDVFLSWSNAELKEEKP